MNDKALKEEIDTWILQAYVNGSLDVNNPEPQGSDVCTELVWEAVLKDRERAVKTAQINMVKYYDQIPKNNDMNWKGLFKDNLAHFKYELAQLSNSTQTKKRNEMKNNNDTTREDIKHIIGACVCKNDDKTCWYTHNAQEVENDSTVQDNQVNAVLNLILQDRESAVREAKLEAEAKQAIQAHIDKRVNESNKELFKALRSIWSNPPKEYVEQGSNELYWNRTSLLKILDTLEAEWENLNA